MTLFQELTDSINNFLQDSDPHVRPMTSQEVAMGFIAVANETMCRPIRALTQVGGSIGNQLMWVWFFVG